MAITQFLWQHTPDQRVPLTVEGNDTVTSLWTKERASRTTTKRPERLTLKYYASGDKPVEKVYGTLWQSAPTPQNDVSGSFEYSSSKISGVVPEGKKWLWQKTTPPPVLEMVDILPNRPPSRAETMTSCIPESSILSTVPRELIQGVPGVQVCGWSGEKSLWKKQEICGPLPNITPPTPLWSHEKASRTTNLSPQPLLCYPVRQRDVVEEVATGNLWTVESELDHQKASVDADIDWLARSCRRVDTYLESNSPTPAASLKARKIVDTPIGKVVDHMWGTEEGVKGKRGEKRRMDHMGTENVNEVGSRIIGTTIMITDIMPIKVQLNQTVLAQKLGGQMWCQPVQKALSLRENPISMAIRPRANSLEVAPSHSLLWTKGLASRTTDAAPIRIVVVQRQFTGPLVSGTGNLWHKTVIKPDPVGLWKAKMKPTGLWHKDGLTPTLFEMEEARKAPLWLNTPIYRADIFSTDRSPLPGKPASCSNLSPASGPLWEPKLVTTAVITPSINGLWESRQIKRSGNTFALNNPFPSPSLSTISTLDDDLLTLSPTSEGTVAVEPDRTLIRSDTNASFTEGLWRRREAETHASTAGEIKSLWNANLAAPIDRELRRNKVLTLEKPRVGGKKKKTPLPKLTAGNLRDLSIKEEEEAAAANPGLSLWRRPSPMMERMFLALSSQNTRDESEVILQQQQEVNQSPPQETPVLCEVPSPPVPLPALQPKEEPQETKVKEKEKEKKKYFTFSTFLRITSRQKHLKPVITDVHAHATVPGPSTSQRGEGSFSSSDSKRRIPWLTRKKIVR